MAQSFATPQGTLIIPGAYPSYTVAQSNAGISTTGILMLVGEADAGPDFTAEADLAANIYGPNQLADVQAKYKTGPLVDAFNGACVPSIDPAIPGSFNRAILVKTNVSAKASAPLLNWASSAYGTLEDKSFGKLGNLISFQITAKTSETLPTTGPFAFLLPIASTNISARFNGGAEHDITLGALETPTAFVAAINGAGLAATGGVDRGVVAGPLVGNLSLTVISGNKVEIDCSVPFAASTSAIGDTLYIAASSVLASVHANNAGSYIVTGASASAIEATKLLDVTGAHNALTPPTTQTAIAIVAATDLKVYSAVTISSPAGNPIDGLGKSFEINQLTSGTGLLQDVVYTMGSSVPAVATFFSTAAQPLLVTSATEYVADLSEGRQVDSISDDVSAGGPPVLLVGYEGTTASLVNDGTNLTFTVVGGSGSSLGPIALKDFPTIADIAAYIASFPGYSALPGTAIYGSRPSTSLDQGTFAVASTFGTQPGRIKQDAYAFYNALLNNAALTQLAVQALAGLPAPTASVKFLTGGSRGATTDQIYAAALQALTMVRANFLVPLFARDATGDIADGITDPSSSYTIAGIHASSRSHVLQMSTLKKKRNRQAFLAYRGAFLTAANTAANLASFRCSLTFQDVKDTGTDGSVDQFQPWMAAVKAAAMQAAGFYKAIFNKLVNISGELQAAGDFNDQDDDAMEMALQSGLLPLQTDATGGFEFVSDQTTYGKDNNFVYNSIQAVYVADTIALTLAQQMQQAFVGQNLADISASLALNTLEGIMENLRKLKLITFSDDAPKGFKNAVIRITGPAMTVSLEVKEATALYFVPISFQISQVQQSATQ